MKIAVYTMGNQYLDTHELNGADPAPFLRNEYPTLQVKYRYSLARALYDAAPWMAGFSIVEGKDYAR